MLAGANGTSSLPVLFLEIFCRCVRTAVLSNRFHSHSLMKCFAAPLVCGFLLAGVSALSAQTVPSTVAVAPATTPTATAAAAIAQQSPWDISTSLRGSVGWRENVTVSSVNSLDRMFWRAEADVFAIRPINDRWEFIGFLSGDVLRYVSPPPNVSGEQQWLGHLEGRWQPDKWFRASLKAVGFRQDIFTDPSLTEGLQSPAVWVRLHGEYVNLTPRISLPGGFAIEPSFEAKRIRYLRGYNGDNNGTRPGLGVLWSRSDLLTLSVTGYEHIRHYSDLLQSTGRGRLLPHRLLSLHQREYEGKASSTFEGGGKWTVTTIVGRLENRDRAFGFLDYNQKRADLTVNWSRGAWRVRAEGEAQRFDYTIQTVGTGTATTPRVGDVFDASGRIERDLNKRWMIFAENRWERNRSNLDDPSLGYRFSYRTDTALIGLQRSF